MFLFSEFYYIVMVIFKLMVLSKNVYEEGKRGVENINMIQR